MKEKIINFIKNIQRAPYEVRVVYHRIFFAVFGFLFLMVSMSIINGNIRQAYKGGKELVEKSSKSIDLTPLNSLKEDAGALKDSAASIFNDFRNKSEKDYFEVLNGVDQNNLNQENISIQSDDSVSGKINRLPVEEY